MNKKSAAKAVCEYGENEKFLKLTCFCPQSKVGMACRKPTKVTGNIQTIPCNDTQDNNVAFKQNKTRSTCLPVAMIIMTIVIKQHYTLFCLEQASSSSLIV